MGNGDIFKVLSLLVSFELQLLGLISARLRRFFQYLSDKSGSILSVDMPVFKEYYLYVKF